LWSLHPELSLLQVINQVTSTAGAAGQFDGRVCDGARLDWEKRFIRRRLLQSQPPGRPVWFDDAPPARDNQRPRRGFVDRGTVELGHNNPAPFSGSTAHQSALVSGIHEHSFTGATQTLAVYPGDMMFVYVYLDPSIRRTRSWWTGMTVVGSTARLGSESHSMGHLELPTGLHGGASASRPMVAVGSARPPASMEGATLKA